MSKLIILSGISGAGKTTYVKQYVKANPNTIIINRDSLRESLTGKPAAEYNRNPNFKIESVVTGITKGILRSEPTSHDIIIDNTNVKLNYIIDIIHKWNQPIERILIECPVDLAKKRVQQRDGYEDVNYIDKQYEQLQELKKRITFDKIIKYESIC